MPAPIQACSLNEDASFLTMEAYTAGTARYDYQHVGRQVVMCPNTTTGLTEWEIYPTGSNDVGCGTTQGGQGAMSDGDDFSGGTHVLGNYFDAWRRGYLRYKGTNLAADSRVLAVMCQQCTVATGSILDQIQAPARAGGPVTCVGDADCNQQKAYAAAVAVGNGYSAKWAGKSSVCQAYTCTTA